VQRFFIGAAAATLIAIWYQGWLGWVDIDAPVMTGILALSAVVFAFAGPSCKLFTSPCREELLRNHWVYPSFWFRMFSHILGHSSMDHLVHNGVALLIVGPACEAAYGSDAMFKFVLIEAVCSTLVTMVSAPRRGVLGASGIVFMTILLASLTKKRPNTVPLTMIIVAPLKLWGELSNTGANDGVSHLGHLSGGLLGIMFGLTTASAQITGIDTPPARAFGPGSGLCASCARWCD
jgi:rhomboid protease GluP